MARPRNVDRPQYQLSAIGQLVRDPGTMSGRTREERRAQDVLERKAHKAALAEFRGNEGLRTCPKCAMVHRG